MVLLILFYLVSACFFISILKIAALLSNKLHLPIEIYRKSVHILMGLAAISFPYFVSTLSQVILLALVFFGILESMRRYPQLFGGIGHVLRNEKRSSAGDFYFVAGITVLLLTCRDERLIYNASILVLAFGDTAAVFASKICKKKHPLTPNKSLEGSLAFFITSFFALSCYFSFTANNNLILPSLFICLIATVGEALSNNGSDNLTVPLLTASAFNLLRSCIFSIWSLIIFGTLFLLYFRTNHDAKPH